MEQYKIDFIEFALKSKALKFGSFTLKSGRQSPFFFNVGAFSTGEEISKLGEYYAKAIDNEFKEDFDILFGPSYKGIPLSIMTTTKLFELCNRNVSYSTNRKEAKDHGEKGIIMGAQLLDNSKIVLIDDVVTSGKSVEETFSIFNDVNKKSSVIGLIVSLDREEKALDSNYSALQEIALKHNLKACSIVKMHEVIEYTKEAHKEIITADLYTNILEYYKHYGSR